MPATNLAQSIVTRRSYYRQITGKFSNSLSGNPPPPPTPQTVAASEAPIVNVGCQPDKHFAGVAVSSKSACSTILLPVWFTNERGMCHHWLLYTACPDKIKSRIAMAKAAFNKKKKNLFTSKLDFNLRKKLVKCYVWSMALYGAETWTLRATDQKHLESFEMWCWRRMEKIS